ncbi:MAG TPA: DUF1272 domain-containing protein [Methylomirabilota bacterium]|jgi:hypothetical protein|nr:DUF1272 domain-containing protein [Methylomirabilota bacterium]
MLDLRPGCELCDRDLPPDSTDAMICSFECTFCAPCVRDVLHGVCPNCGGGLVARPVRPAPSLAKHPASTMRVVKPLDAARHAALLARYRDVPSERR